MGKYKIGIGIPLIIYGIILLLGVYVLDWSSVINSTFFAYFVVFAIGLIGVYLVDIVKKVRAK